MKRLYVKSIPCSSREQAVLCSTDQDPAGPGPSRSRENDGELWEGEARARGGGGGGRGELTCHPCRGPSWGQMEQGLSGQKTGS